MADRDHTTTLKIVTRRASTPAAGLPHRRRSTAPSGRINFAAEINALADAWADRRSATPAPLVSRYDRATTAIPATFLQPGPTARSKPRSVTGRLLGTMHAGGQVHHYRIEGDDGVLYLVPPGWIDVVTFASITASGAGATREYNRRAVRLQELATDWGLNVTIHALNDGVTA